VVSPRGDYGYFGSSSSPAVISKIDLNTFTQVGTVSLAPGYLYAAVLPGSGKYAYFGSHFAPELTKVDVENLTFAGSIRPPYDSRLAVLSPDGHYAYFASESLRGSITKVDLIHFKATGSLVLSTQQHQIWAAVISPRGDFAYFVAIAARGPPAIIKVALTESPSTTQELPIGTAPFTVPSGLWHITLMLILTVASMS
jgi:hypothetical protein